MKAHTTVINDYLVMSRRPPPDSDMGFWTEHRTKADAIDCAKSVNGVAYSRSRHIVSGTVNEIIVRLP